LAEYFKKLRNFVVQPGSYPKEHLKEQIGQSLHRWDNQDFRVDLNWTDFEYHVIRHKVKFIKDHTRFLEFTNSGTLPLLIKKITIDETNNRRCSDFWDILTVLNCQDLVGRSIQPNESVSLELGYHETFRFLSTQKTLTIETEHFS
jgi:hypothetical protein